MSAGSGVASPGDGDALGDAAEEDVPPVLPASPVARIASGAVSLSALAERWPSPSSARGIFPSADHWLASSCFLLVEAYVSIVERLLQPFQNTLRETAINLWAVPRNQLGEARRDYIQIR